MIPADTSPEAHAVQAAIWRRMTSEQRSELAAQMSEDARSITLDAIRARHPEYDAEQVKRALVRLLYGDEFARAAWPA